jgi:hypothetical protein
MFEDWEKKLEQDLQFVNGKLECDPDNRTLKLERRMILWELNDETED